MKLYRSCTPDENRASAGEAEARENWRTRDDSNVRPLPSEDIGGAADRAFEADKTREQGANIGTKLYRSCTLGILLGLMATSCWLRGWRRDLDGWLVRARLSTDPNLNALDLSSVGFVEEATIAVRTVPQAWLIDHGQVP